MLSLQPCVQEKKKIWLYRDKATNALKVHPDIPNPDSWQLYAGLSCSRSCKHAAGPELAGLPIQQGDGTVSYEDPFSAASAVQWFNGKEFKGMCTPPSLPTLSRSRWDRVRQHSLSLHAAH